LHQVGRTIAPANLLHQKIGGKIDQSKARLAITSPSRHFRDWAKKTPTQKRADKWKGSIVMVGPGGRYYHRCATAVEHAVVNGQWSMVNQAQKILKKTYYVKIIIQTTQTNYFKQLLS